MSIKKELIKKKVEENEEELLVFGYSCKLFRDDEKAKIIDEGQHLIPWMGNDSLRIDRYDARGTLADLGRYEPPPGGFDRFIELTENEKTLEFACDSERYRALHSNEEQEELYKEEQDKRADGKVYGQVGYQYDDSQEEIGPKPEPEIEDDSPFVPAPMLDIPMNMSLPTTMKHNAVIEKTAMFISSQGGQMEIILKAKQANNPMFDFLTFGNALHDYYKLVLGCVKSGRYIPSSRPEPVPSPPPAPQISVEAPPPPLIGGLDESTVYFELLGKLQKNAKVLKKQEVIKVEKPVPEIPSIESQILISKTACYAVKKGRGFEAIVKVKKDPRFEFLDLSHKFHSFYIQKIAYYKKLGVGIEKKPEPKKKAEEPKSIAPICFAIKPKEAPVVIEKSALPVEENSDDEADDFDVENIEVKVPTARDKQLQQERKRKVSAFLKSLNVKEGVAEKRLRSTSVEDDNSNSNS